MKIALCDDDINQISIIKKILDNYSNESKITPITVTSFNNGADLLSETEKGTFFDVYLLDILMPLIDGINLAKEIRQKDNLGKILFLTSCPQYGAESYEVDAYYYLLKPVNPEKLYSLLDAIQKETEVSNDIFHIFKTRDGIKKIIFSKVEYIEVIDKKLFFNMYGGETISAWGNLSEIENLLIDEICFEKCHRSYIINMNYIDKFTSSKLKTLSFPSVPISRNYSANLKSKFLQYHYEKAVK